jgi:hypothetical protein
VQRRPVHEQREADAFGDEQRRQHHQKRAPEYR